MIYNIYYQLSNYQIITISIINIKMSAPIRRLTQTIACLINTSSNVNIITRNSLLNDVNLCTTEISDMLFEMALENERLKQRIDKIENNIRLIHYKNSINKP